MINRCGIIKLISYQYSVGELYKKVNFILDTGLLYKIYMSKYNIVIIVI